MSYDSGWVRSSLSQLDFLMSARSVDMKLVPLIEFSIRWAPFGGADSGDLLISFGVSRRRFVEMMRASLQPRPIDNQERRWLKRRLLDALAAAWDVDNPASSGEVRC
ncbi:hypothetical protein C5E45_24565 [Nocardia nova]|uniref:Uncharacterized protein n=2 Tax=Nocardia nova TaxID=37330 RepID=A0A2S6AKH2_9NOCA|nr:hypothetical protein [Nocardia nova]PPJ24954.1 hypothetical protein C5E41_21340 [Nocardia nova]PPJ35716.1 hypothetical protein C5E45_24565 [Nocardia nova]